MKALVLGLAVLMLAGAPPGRLRAAQPVAAATPGAAVPGPQDLQFVRLALRLHAAHEAAARQALAGSHDVRVRQFARRVLRYHSAARARLGRLAAGKGMALPAPPQARGGAGFGLQGLHGAALDRRFVAAVGIDGQRDVLRVFGLQERWGEDPALVRFASSRLPVFGRLLAAAEALHTQLQPAGRDFPEARLDAGGARLPVAWRRHDGPASPRGSAWGPRRG